MIARLRGELAGAEGNVLIVDIGGVGYRVTVPVNILGEIGLVGSPVTLFTHTYVREDDLSLYGFSSHEQLKAFEILIGVSGIGPKVAMAVLSAIDVGSLAHAVSIGDTRTLVRIPGLGLKTAQRLVLEVRDKMAALASVSRSAGSSGKATGAPASAAAQFESDIVDALVGLGYSRKDSERAADIVIRESGPDVTSANALREALNVLTGNRPS
jgi:Holliday junction DNA helicase RuvA